jgi:ADP-ribose pyrophosphatase
MKYSLAVALCLFISSLSAANAAKKNKNLPTTVEVSLPAPSKDVQSSHIEDYLVFLKEHLQTLGPLGDHSKGEIEIVIDPLKIAQIEQTTGRKAGLVYQDKYWMWINDPVQFPNDSYGIYSRILWNRSLEGRSGVAVLALTPEGKIALNRNYRHATRSWEYELPRGLVNSGETPEAAAVREAQEETGMILTEIRSLGEMAPDTGLTNTLVSLFFARTAKKEAATPEASEAIASVDTFTVQEVKKGLAQGYLTVEIEGKTLSIPMRDPFLAFALLQAETKGFLSKSRKRRSAPAAIGAAH